MEATGPASRTPQISPVIPWQPPGPRNAQEETRKADPEVCLVLSHRGNLNLFLCRGRLCGLGSFEYGMSACVLLHQDRQTDRGQHENHGAPGSNAGEDVGRSARAKCGLRTLAAKGASKISALALLEQNDDDQKNTDQNMNGENQIKHA